MAFATIGTKGIEDAAIATADIADNAVTSAKTSGIPARPNATPLIINGSMAVAQRATSKASISGGGYNTVDRYQNNNAGAFIGTWTQTQESLSSGDAFNDGFAKSLKMDCTTADASPAANSSNWIQYGIEGQDLQLLKHGTANAEKLTLSFWIKATKTGTNIVRLYKTDADRSCSQAYTVSSSDTWEYKVLNFPADTTGAVIANDNTLGMSINFAIAMGSNFTSGTLATSWAANVSANDYVGQVNNADSTSNNWEITGVQLEVGEYSASTLPSFQHETFGDNLARCQRYFVKIETGGSSSLEMAVNKANPNNYSQSRGVYCLAVPMRSGATTTLSGTVKAGYLGGDYSLTDQGFSTVAPTYGSTTDRVNIVSTYMNQSSNNSQNSMIFTLQASSSLSLDAEL